MKKILFIVFIWLCAINSVYASTHDVQAKYEVSYNIDLYTVTINNNTKLMNLDNYSLEFSSSQKNIEVVVIKLDSEANDYAKQFTKTDDNYFIGFFKDNKKITVSDITLNIKNKNKVLTIYDNQGNIIDNTNESIKLTSNNYFMNINNKLDNEDNNYLELNIDSDIKDLENIEINENTNIQIYNYKNIPIDQNQKLGTGYRVVINNSGNINEYKIIVKGDTTGDAKINLNDITRLYHYYKKIEQMDDVFVLAGDVANNNLINLNDITKLYHYYKKIIPNL